MKRSSQKLHTFHYNPVAPPGGQHYPKDYSNKRIANRKTERSRGNDRQEERNYQPEPSSEKETGFKMTTAATNYDNIKSYMFMK